MKIEMSKTFQARLKGRVEGYDFEVGVLNDKPHYKADYNETKSFAGGPVLKTSRVASELSTGQILVKNMERTGIDFLRKPLQETNSDIQKFTTQFLRFIFTKGMSIKRVENLLQAIVRNPILRLEYGNNIGITADAKGFNRHLFGTGQMFKAIIAKAKKKRV